MSPEAAAEIVDVGESAAARQVPHRKSGVDEHPACVLDPHPQQIFDRTNPKKRAVQPASSPRYHWANPNCRNKESPETAGRSMAKWRSWETSDPKAPSVIDGLEYAMPAR